MLEAILLSNERRSRGVPVAAALARLVLAAAGRRGRGEGGGVGGEGERESRRRTSADRNSCRWPDSPALGRAESDVAGRAAVALPLSLRAAAGKGREEAEERVRGRRVGGGARDGWWVNGVWLLVFHSCGGLTLGLGRWGRLGELRAGSCRRTGRETKRVRIQERGKRGGGAAYGSVDFVCAVEGLGRGIVVLSVPQTNPFPCGNVLSREPRSSQRWRLWKQLWSGAQGKGGNGVEDGYSNATGRCEQESNGALGQWLAGRGACRTCLQGVSLWRLRCRGAVLCSGTECVAEKWGDTWEDSLRKAKAQQRVERRYDRLRRR